MSYFDDVLERLASYLAGRRQWNTLLEVFTALERRRGDGAALSQYAWILGRAAEEGYLRTERRAEDFFRVAFENERGTIYYRTMAASKLGASFRPESRGSRSRTRNPSDELNFLLGFFEYGAASFALPFIRAREGALSVAELRMIAEAQASSGCIRDSLNLVSRYLRRENHEINRQDLYLFYPRPFQELIERYATEMEVGIEVLYALIRTESFFDHTAVSRAGATGLAQLMPATAAEMAVRIFREGGPDLRGPDMDLTDPKTNIHLGSFYLRRLNELLENPMLAILAYNGGMGRVRRWLDTDRQQGALPLDLFLETIEYREAREYGRLVLGAAAIYGHLYFGKSMKEVAAQIFG
jgi:soluble lytic murein transglycosylase